MPKRQSSQIHFINLCGFSVTIPRQSRGLSFVSRSKRLGRSAFALRNLAPPKGGTLFHRPPLIPPFSLFLLITNLFPYHRFISSYRRYKIPSRLPSSIQLSFRSANPLTPSQPPPTRTPSRFHIQRPPQVLRYEHYGLLIFPLRMTFASMTVHLDFPLVRLPAHASKSLCTPVIVKLLQSPGRAGEFPYLLKRVPGHYAETLGFASSPQPTRAKIVWIETIRPVTIVDYCF
jgi:hypothetical protein